MIIIKEVMDVDVGFVWFRKWKETILAARSFEQIDKSEISGNAQ
jgi:hypothetical protein